MADADDNLSGGIQPMFDDPNLPKGWSREVIQRKTGRFDVFIISDKDRRFKNRSELAQYLKENKMKMKPDEFDFSVMGKNYVPLRSSRRAAAKSEPADPPGQKRKKGAIDNKKEAKGRNKVTKGSVKAEVALGRKSRGKIKQEEEKENGKSKKKAKQEPSEVKKESADSSKSEEEAEPKEETSVKEEIKQEPSEGMLPAKRGRVKPKRYLTPEPEPAPRRAKLKALFKDIEDGPPKKEEPATPNRGRGRPKKSADPEPKEEIGKKTLAKSKGKTPAKKVKAKKSEKEAEDPDAAKKSQILAEIEAELAEINGTTSRKKSPKKRRTSVTKPQPCMEPENKDRPALEGFEPDPPHKRQRSESKSIDVKEEANEPPEESLIEPPEFGEEFGRRRSARARRIDIPALLNPDPESPDEEEVVAKPKKTKKMSPKPKPKPEKRKAKATKKRRGSKAITDEDEGEAIPIDSLEGAINSASSLLDDHSDSSGEQDASQDGAAGKPTHPKQSRSGRNVRSPRRPMESDFETDFSTLRRAMNATTSDFASRKRKIHIPPMNTPEMRYEQNYNPVAYDYFASANAFRRTSETARTRTFEENKMEKTLSLMDPSLQLSGPQDREPLLLETHLRAAEPPAAFPQKRQRKSSSHLDMRTPTDKVFYRKHKPGVSKQQSAERSLLKNMRLDSGADSGDHMESLLTPQSSSKHHHRDHRDLISEMTPPPTHPIIQADDHNYSLSSRYLGESAQSSTQQDGDSVETRVMTIDQHDLLNEISAQAGSSAAVTSSAEGVTVPITSVSGVDGDSATPPKEIVIYVGDKPTIVPVMQDESGMSVITLPNGIAEEEIQASLESAAL